MRTSEAIRHLTALIEQHGDCELIITDGFGCRFYREGDEAKYRFQYIDGEIEIGVGGCNE